MPSSRQEAFVHEMTQHSFGAPYLFEPDTYMKGNATREPADLAWICRKTIILMNMRESVEPFDEQLDHNLRQLRGWIRIWAQGRHLTGQNNWQSFDVAFDDVEVLVLISVVDGQYARCQVHTDILGSSKRPEERGVTAVASVPGTVLSKLAELGGGMTDFADLLLRAASTPGGLSKEDSITALLEHRETAGVRARLEPYLRTNRNSITDDWVYRLFLGMRALLNNTTANKDAAMVDGTLSVYNDLDWESLTKLTLFSSDLIETVREVEAGQIGPTATAMMLEIEQYNFLIGAADLAHRDSDEFTKKIMNQVNSHAASGGLMPITLVFFINGRPVVKYIAPILLGFQEAGPTRSGEIFRSLELVGRASRNPTIEGVTEY